MSVIGSLEVLLTATDQGLVSGLRNAEQSVTSFASTISSGQLKMAGFGVATAALGAGLITFAAAIGGTAVAAASAFDEQMAKVIALAGDGKESFAQMSDEVLKLSRTIPQSGAQLAQGLYFVRSAGFAGADAMNILTVSAKAASVGMTDTKVVADAVTSILNAYGLTARDASKVTDQLTAAVVNGKTEYDAFASSVGMVMPEAHALGVTFTDVLGAMSAMTKAGINASEGATQLKGIFQTLLNPTKTTKEELTSLGMSVEGLRAEVKDKGLPATLQTINDKIKELGLATTSTAGAVGLSKKEIAAQSKELRDNASAAKDDLQTQKLNLEEQLHNLETSKQVTEQVAHHKKVKGEEITTYTTHTKTVRENTDEQKKLKDQIFAINQEMAKKGIATNQDILALKDHKAATTGAAGATQNQMEAIDHLFPRMRGITGELILAQNNAKSYTDIVKELNSSQGLTNKSFDEFSKMNPDVKFKLLKNAVDEANIKLGNALLPSVLSLVKAITPLVEGISNWIQHHQTLSAAILVGIGVLGAALVAVAAVAAAIGIGLPALIAVGVAAVAGLGTAFVMNLDKIKKAWESFIGYISGAINGLISGLENLGKKAVNALSYLNPLAKHSPSLVEQVASGVSQIKASYESLNQMQMPALSAVPVGGGGSGSYNNTNNSRTSNINLQNTFNVRGEANASNIAEYLAFQISHKGL